MSDPLVRQIRAFNRAYVSKLGILNRSIHDSAYSLVEGRVLFELGSQRELFARDIAEELNIDEGYLSRILNKFSKQKLIIRHPDKHDSRKKRIILSAKGNNIYQQLNKKADQQISSLLSEMTPTTRKQLLSAMERLSELL